ncbi:unnamed protein product [Mytilus edulis]|uniref:Fork-head domain-containing protein n=1 Tax=Mytilus edulis TaxID=6550 RepID=A0A8S3QSD0_MYTED|nr:unnamed protein product [Mytilus edulis]
MPFKSDHVIKNCETNSALTRASTVLSEIYYLTKADTERVNLDSISSEVDGVWTPSFCASESESSYSNSAEFVQKDWLPFNISNKNELSCCDTYEKPSHSYIALISMAILSKQNKKMLLSDIYQYIMDNFPFYNNTEKAWRNSIRHNLSINECFVKSGRSVSGKVNYWSVHQDFIDDFAKRDFRRRNTRRRSRKSVVKTADSSSNKFNTRNDNEYVPMTNNHIPRRIIQSPVPRFGMAKTQYTAPMQSFGSDSHVPVARKSWSEGQLCNSPSTNCTSFVFIPSSKSSFYSSCQI